MKLSLTYPMTLGKFLNIFSVFISSQVLGIIVSTFQVGIKEVKALLYMQSVDTF